MTEPQNAREWLHEQLTWGRRLAELRLIASMRSAPPADAEERAAA